MLEKEIEVKVLGFEIQDYIDMVEQRRFQQKSKSITDFWMQKRRENHF